MNMGQTAIDIVYLWVDGADPDWRARRQSAYAEWLRAHPEQLALYGNVAGRYRDNGELMFNLRALEKFFPGHGRVYLVTDRQTPAWLRPSGRLTIIDHAQLIPEAARPVFDSGHIESYLHHIDGLSERFIYFNDDVFFGAPFDPALWFGQRLTVFTEAAAVAHGDALSADAPAPVNGAVLSQQWLSAQYPDYRHQPRLYSHAPRPMLKSAMQELERLAPELFRQVRSTVFRSWRVPPLVSDLVPRWMVHRGYAQQQVLDPLYISSGAADASAQFDMLKEKFGALPFFCINDTCDDAEDNDPRLLLIADTLARLLPQPSSFEYPRE
ncbi:Stealth CR1 domain-containing protein [Janthinobacterium agaricidamnosum]|uniref:Capsular polysaccharide phosphotransferase SacB n=1 Tax=Janthinobacterium agaricidamnosum NBRC 102515 = DSM 9628 TaxID=1349767 RepID=W0V6U4_9BURK|nr:Stealth CR1 domain-containing protein [Janthinobacterium agaricidamnosum]CDG84544.1 capsular polysaccharide phosphotransferase wcwK [Janthinobacterium agaricidamnosum NBRC 102515 = DSM 9628]